MRRAERARAVDANDRSCLAFFWVYTRASVLSTPTYISASICPETAASSKKRVPVVLLAADTRTHLDGGSRPRVLALAASRRSGRFHLVDHELSARRMAERRVT